MDINKNRFRCGGCSLLCDDIEFNIENNKVVDTFNCCGRADINYKRTDNSNRILEPMVKENNSFKVINLDEAIKKSAEILSNAKSPIIFGFSNCGCEEIAQGILLGRKLNGYVDTEQSVCLGILNKKLKEYKIRHVKLEELKETIDLIIFWGSNISDLHLRLASKFAVFPRSSQIQGGKESRTVICIDIRSTPTEKIADIAYYVLPGKDKELINALLKLNSGENIKEEKIAGLSLKEIKDFYGTLKDAENKIIFIGPGLTAGGENYEALDAMVRLAKEMNIKLLATTSDSNTFGCDFMMRAMTRYPFAVNYKNNKPKFNYSEYSLPKLIYNDNIDAALIVNADPLAKLPFKLAKKLAKLPLIVIDHHNSLTTEFAKIIIPMSMPGVECSGTFIRIDKKIVKVDKILNPPDKVISGSEIIKRIIGLINK
ncbi:MAG: formylmethanofuran dehydrogenase subunit B [Candidatus Helarchaeota archaeon]